MIPIALALAMIVVFPAPGPADVCDGVPSCQAQPQSPVSVGSWATKGWAWYCGGGYPYYWTWTKDGASISVVENPFEEGGNAPSKFDATLTHWGFGTASVTVTLGCSQVNQYGPCPSNSSGPVADPKYPIVSGTEKNYCSNGPVPVCIQTWEEMAPDGTAYYCTADVGATWCTTCS